ncbi:MAG: hypothetical protein ACRDOV_02625, partial [Streptomyces sp.]
MNQEFKAISVRPAPYQRETVGAAAGAARAAGVRPAAGVRAVGGLGYSAQVTTDLTLLPRVAYRGQEVTA